MADITAHEVKPQLDDDNLEKSLLYALDDSPPWILALLLGLQVPQFLCILVPLTDRLLTSEVNF